MKFNNYKEKNNLKKAQVVAFKYAISMVQLCFSYKIVWIKLQEKKLYK